MSSIERGKFYCFEGIDGAGKTALASAVSGALSEQGCETVFIDKKNVALISKPSVRNQLGHIKQALWDYPSDLDLGSMGDYHWITLIASWYSTLEYACIRPLLEQGKTVIADGWVYKYIARFSLKESVPGDIVREIFCQIPQPDKVFLLDVCPRIAAQRKGILKASESGVFDGETGDKVDGFVSYQSRVNEQLKALADMYGWSVVDANSLDVSQLSHQLVSDLLVK